MKKVIQRTKLLENQLKLKEQVKILFLELIQNSYGNYVFQEMLKNWKNCDFTDIQKIIIQNV